MTEFTCADRRLCVQKERVGDEYNDCGDGLDESDCGQYECQYWQAKCVSTGVCIHKGLECNALWDCEDGNNENTCGDQNPILATTPLPVTTLSSKTTGGTIFRFETVEESNEQTTMTGTNG